MSIPREEIAGLILIGGQSRRMGRAKALMEIAGQPLWRRANDLLTPFVAKVFLLGTVAELDSRTEVTQLRDDPACAGPLSGLLSGLEGSGFEHHLLVAVDYPFVSPSLLSRLRDMAGTCDAACARVGGRIEPLIGYYRRTCTTAIREMAQGNETRTFLLLERVQSRFLSDDEIVKIDPAKMSFFNVNTPSDLLEAARLVQSGQIK